MTLKNIKSTENRFILLITFFILIQFQTYGQEIRKVVMGTKFRMESKILNEERTYIVGLPKSYHESSNTYPVLILLDGESNFPVLSGMIDKMTDRQIPEMIIVAIVNTDRTRDFTPTNSVIFLDGSEKPQYQKTSGGSKAFLGYLEKELLVEIDKVYRTNSYKTLVGHSYGGLLAGLSYLSDDSSFDSFIAIDPSFWWDNQIILKDVDSANIERLKSKKFYISSAYNYKTWKNFGLTRKSQDLFFAELQNKNILSPNLKLQYFEEENHWTVPTLSFYYGLKFIYKDFYMADIETKSIEDIVSYYKNRFGGKFSPPENIINSLGYGYLDTGKEEDKDKALEFFQLNVSNYPDSYNAFDSLGDAYMTIGDKKRALENFEKSLKLNASNENAKRMINKLKN
ncbi:MAG: hypothetical protein IH949_04985 [Bacteroidetes bacterium]|nr:hypothetical protein [Bacteroidota bacterium]